MKNNTIILIISTITFITSLFIFSYLMWTYSNTWMEFPFELLWLMFTTISMVTMFLSAIGVFTEHNRKIRRLNK
jgi:glycerol-3-phosphate acyltransferase PlsY